MHDMTPTLNGVKQAVYCHNASPFNTINFKDLYFQPTQFFFRLFYKYLYSINLKKNCYVIVQQFWIKNKFIELFKLSREIVIVSPPVIPKIPLDYLNLPYQHDINLKTFFFFKFVNSHIKKSYFQILVKFFFDY